MTERCKPSEDIILQRAVDRLWGIRWVATYESYDGPDSPIGYGKTPTDAVEELLEMSGDDR